MLPSDAFAEAIHDVPPGTAPEDVLGPYYPEAAYCPKDVFESSGASASAGFAACKSLALIPPAR